MVRVPLNPTKKQKQKGDASDFGHVKKKPPSKLVSMFLKKPKKEEEDEMEIE